MRIYSLLLLLVLVAALLLVGSPITAQTVVIPTATPTQIVIVVHTPLPVTPIATETNGCYAPLALTIGGGVLLRGGVNVRSAPSASAPLMNYYPSQVLLHLDGGPVCADGYNWWQISGVGVGGWVIEGKPGQYFLQQYIPPNTINCAEPLATITVGGQMRAVTGSRIRQTPANNGFVITVVQPGAALDVLQGPVCADQINWWRVRAPYGSAGTVEGWIAEGFPGQYYVEGLSSNGQPAVACADALRLHSGSRVAVTYSDGVPRRLRAAPSASAPIVASLIDGVALDVIADGATCADGYNWWNVQVVSTGITGWIAEGRPGNYWFDVLIN